MSNMQTTLEQPEIVWPIDLYAEHAKEKAQLPANWRIYKWECFPHDGTATIYVAVTGAVCEHFKTGKDKNDRNWKLRDKTTERTVNLPCAEHDAWKREWEKRTNKCSECTGTGETIASVSVREGTKMRPCYKCKGAGTPNFQGSENNAPAVAERHALPNQNQTK